jgi:4-hydroxy-2-oxoheptanedioate aldolase
VLCRLPLSWVALSGVGLCLVASSSRPQAQGPPPHINPIIEKLAKGQPVFGTTVRDLSIENAHSLSRADLDYVRVEMEHSPMNFDALRLFLLGMLDKAAILKQGDARMRVAPIVRLAPYGREQAHWVAKQALDQGMTGIIFNQIDTREQALSAVQSMRYPQRKGTMHQEPIGMRGFSPQNALWFWGISSEEYVKRADLWPLNPQGDLIAIMLIESAEGLKNVDQIAAVPGVGGLYAGTGDLALSMGVEGGSPEVEGAVQTILKACLAHRLACKINTTARDIRKRIEEGWRILNIGDADGGITPAVEAGLRAARTGR